MMIRRACEKDVPAVTKLLSEVLEIHADIRPDIFISGTTKYTLQELIDIFHNDAAPVFVAVDENDEVLGYAFCVIHEPIESNNMVPHRSIYIDDLCVDESSRGMHVGRQLYEYVLQYARKIGCYHVTLNVWQGNDKAQRFYEHMGLKPQKTVMEVIL